jgi:Hint domain
MWRPILSTENFYHVAGIVALSGDLMNVALPARRLLPISNLDLAILKITGVPVTSFGTCFALELDDSAFAQPSRSGALFDRAIQTSGDCTSSHHALGTRILPRAGHVLIETLWVGDFAMTRDGVQPIVWSGHRTIDCRHHPDPVCVYPIGVPAHAFGENLPERHLMVSGNHA